MVGEKGLQIGSINYIYCNNRDSLNEYTTAKKLNTIVILLFQDKIMQMHAEKKIWPTCAPGSFGLGGGILAPSLKEN